MRKTLVWWGSAIAVVAGLVSATTSLDLTSTAYAQSFTAPTTTCPSGLATNMTSGAVLTGITPINVGVPTSVTGVSIDKVVYAMDGKPIGRARLVSTSAAPYWTMPWPTQLAPSGPHALQAFVYYNQGSACATQPLGINIAPSTTTATAPAFGIDILPQSWSGLTNSVIDIQVVPNSSLGIPSTEISQYVLYQWETNIGAVAPAMGMARYSSGASAGTGRVRVRAFYGGRETEREMPVQVISQVAATTTTDTTSSSGTTSGSATTTTNAQTDATSSTSQTTTTTTTVAVPLSQEQKLELISKQIESQPEILTCANQNLTAARIEQLKKEGKRLKTDEFAKLRTCFASSSYVVPSSYAPAEPDEVKNALPQTQDARIKDMRTENAPVNSEGTTQKVLRFEGQAAPNSDVLIYVFSEPLVLYAKADANGSWEYDLVDPMEPGNHEAYAVVEDSDGTYKKSGAFSFLIETAEASSENPNGYSFSVQTVGTLNAPASKGRINLYMVGSGVVVVMVLLVGGFVISKTMKHIPNDNSDTSGHGYGA